MLAIHPAGDVVTAFAGRINPFLALFFAFFRRRAT
jgi:hypothetical protein